MSFPKDQLPSEYNRELMTRQIEDIYSTLGQFDDVDGQISELVDELEVMKEGLTSLQNAAAAASIMETTVMPPPVNLEIIKLKNIPLVFVRCKHLEIIKYPYVRGFQFFISRKQGFNPLSECGTDTLTGTHDGVAGMVLSDTASLTHSTIPGRTALYVNVPFFTSMKLIGETVINVTDNSTGVVTAWDPATPWNMTTTLVGGTTNQWNNGDSYEIKYSANENLIHQGPLPFAVYLLKFNETHQFDPQWDGVAYYCKARTYGIGGPRSGRFSDFVCASCTSVDDYETTAPDVDTSDPINHDYDVDLDWEADEDVSDVLDHYRVYRTTANDSNLLTTDTYLIADPVYGTHYEDKGYDAVTNPNGAVPCTTYYYWLRPVDINGNIGDNGASKSGHILIAADPSIYSGVEELDRGWGRRKAWVVKWTCAGDAMGYFVRYRLKTNGGYGIWTVPVYIPHTTEFGLNGGEDIQSYTFHSLVAGRTYTFAVKATWNPMISGVSSNWVTQDYTINNTSVPAAPT